MSFASILLEGYNGYSSEPTVINDPVGYMNEACIECITGLYEASEQFYTGDIIGQTQVLMEGSDPKQKIKELWEGFKKKVVKILTTFIDKLKKIPQWIKNVTAKFKKQTDDLIEEIDEFDEWDFFDEDDDNDDNSNSTVEKSDDWKQSILDELHELDSNLEELETKRDKEAEELANDLISAAKRNAAIKRKQELEKEIIRKRQEKMKKQEELKRRKEMKKDYLKNHPRTAKPEKKEHLVEVPDIYNDYRATNDGLDDCYLCLKTTIKQFDKYDIRDLLDGSFGETYNIRYAISIDRYIEREQWKDQFEREFGMKYDEFVSNVQRSIADMRECSKMTELDRNKLIEILRDTNGTVKWLEERSSDQNKHLDNITSLKKNIESGKYIKTLQSNLERANVEDGIANANELIKCIDRIIQQTLTIAQANLNVINLSISNTSTALSMYKSAWNNYVSNYRTNQ